MPRKPCYWTRKLELDLVEFVREREFIWKPIGNTNHHIEQKYKAYAEFAAQLGHRFTARSVRDRWVNIRSTFNHNLRRVEKSRDNARSSEEVYVPCWPLWKPLQFLREVYKKDGEQYINGPSTQIELKEDYTQIKNENHKTELNIRQRYGRTDRPRQRKIHEHKAEKTNKCKKVLDGLLKAMAPLVNQCESVHEPYWFFGRHVTERLNAMRERDAECASNEILKILDTSCEES